MWEKGNHYYHDYHDYYDYFFVGLGTTDSIQMLFIHYSMIGNSKLLIKCFAEKSDSQAPICINKDEDVLLEHKIIFCCDCEITSLEQTLNYHAIDHHILKKTFLVCLISTLISEKNDRKQDRHLHLCLWGVFLICKQVGLSLRHCYCDLCCRHFISNL